MVSWASDGLIAGYDSITKRLKAGLYHFATPGSVDLNGTTRINFPMGAGLPAATYPNRFDATAPMSFTTGDFTANPGKVLCAALVLADAANFPANYVPTPSEILALGDAKTSVYRAANYLTGPGPISFTFNFAGWSSGLLWNTKYWILLMPTALSDVYSSWSVLNDKPMAGASVDTIGRALSLWANRTPAAPTIVSPANGSIAFPGSAFNIKINPNDPDETAPEDTAKFNDDINGIQIQYAAASTPENPTPTWRELPYDVLIPGTTVVTRTEAWYIRGSRWFNGLTGAPDLEALVANLGCPVVAAGGDLSVDYVAGSGALPSGEWQIRVRTFDYGHPYPNFGTSVSEPGPLGINPATTQLLEPAKDTYPAQNTSPWSDAVRITIPAQVPPPIPLSPADHLAVIDGETVRLTWKYRNTHLPPRSQYRRAVQIREVGDPDWTSIYDSESALDYVDLPPVLTQTAHPPLSLLSDGSFEGGTLDGWHIEAADAALYSVSNVNDVTKAHAGSRFLKVTSTGTAPYAARTFTGIPTAYTKVDLNGWLWVNSADTPFVVAQIYWKDVSGNAIIPGDIATSPYIVSFSTTVVGSSGYYKLSALHPDAPTDLSISRPPGGVDLYMSVFVFNATSFAVVPEIRFDDMTATATAPVLDDFSLSATNEYEWRVSAVDTDGKASDYSVPARFWVVPAPNSGVTRELAASTIDGATLGCGNNRAFIYRRGGRVRVGEVKFNSYVDWGRTRDDMSTAKVVASGWDVDCGNLLARLEPWAYELVIFRENGYSTERVWEGPITLLTYETDKVTIEAKDVMGYAYRRIIKQKMSDAGTGHGTTVVDRARRVLQNVFAPDDPNILAYLRVLARDDDAMQYRSTPAYSRTAFEEIDDMAANAGLDYTCVGRSVMLWGTKHRIGTLPEFKDEDFGNAPIVSVYGMSMANVYAVSDGNGVYGVADRLVDGGDETYGLVEMVSSTWASDSQAESGTYTQAGLATVIASFTEFAERSISDRYPPPVVVRIPDSTTINPGAAISIQHLVPGVVIPLRSTSTLRTVVASQKLDSVKVVQQGGKETVSITVSPFSRDDTAAVDGGDA